MNRSLGMGSLALCVVAVALPGCGKAIGESSWSQVSETTSVCPDSGGPEDLLKARVGEVPVAAEQGARLTAAQQPLPELSHHRGGDVGVTTDPQGHQVTDAVSAVLVDYPETHGGVHWQSEARRVEVFLAPPTEGKVDTRREARSAVEAISREFPTGVSVAFVDVPYSFQRQGEWLDEVSRLIPIGGVEVGI